MNILVSDNGFAPSDEQLNLYGIADLSGALPHSGKKFGVVLSTDTSLESIEKDLMPFIESIDLIKIEIPSFSDGRGFTLAKQLRLIGYRGKLRASGHMIADQYTMARRCGFDDIEIDQQLAARQSVSQWMFRSNWQTHDYQSRLKKSTLENV